jgi:hypothetical protein
MYDSTLTTRSSVLSFAVLGTVGDPEGARTIMSIIALLVVLGVALMMLAVWLHRKTRPDPELLAPLEVMGERKWRRADPVWQRRRLDAIRPTGAAPLEPSIAPPDIDEAFDDGPAASGFADLHGHEDEVPGESDDGEGSDHVTALPPPGADRQPMSGQTPQGLPRPDVDELPDGEVDPEVLAEAMAELDAELGHDPQ